uniref:Uncharacterized protein n=1 Tax=Rhizophora mucronata TaxID=61149 RepID=A0A2P2MX46_RHIMU
MSSATILPSLLQSITDGLGFLLISLLVYPCP